MIHIGIYRLLTCITVSFFCLLDRCLKNVGCSQRIDRGTYDINIHLAKNGLTDSLFVNGFELASSNMENLPFFQPDCFHQQ